MGYSSEKYFSRKIRNTFGKRPKELIIEMKILKIHEYILSSPDDIYYCVAKKFGFEDDNALYKFVKRHTGKSLTELKNTPKNNTV
jgi:AraC-like DNA-binding protein